MKRFTYRILSDKKLEVDYSFTVPTLHGYISVSSCGERKGLYQNCFFHIFVTKRVMKRVNLKDSADLRKLIEEAIEDGIITRQEYETIINLASRDGYIDQVERSLLAELQQMISDGSVKFRKG